MYDEALHIFRFKRYSPPRLQKAGNARSIVDSLRVPAIEMDVVVDAVKRVEKFDVPFFAIPRIGPPPISGYPPWAACRCNRAVDAVPCNPDGNLVAELN